MAKYKAYPKYKDSGIDWIGDVPEGWEVNRVYSVFDETNLRGGSKDTLLTVTQKEGILPQAQYQEKTGKRLSQQASDDYSKYKRVQQNDLIYNKMRMWQGAIGATNFDGCVSPAYVTIRSKKNIVPSYWENLFKTPNFLIEVNRFSQGICDDQNSCNFDNFREIPITIPPLQEQQAIANFLDRETAHIDALIAKKENSIELLKEKRQATIIHAVTKGLNPQANMKDSGIEWIGHMPDEWKKCRLRFLCTITTGSQDTINATDDGQYPFFVRSQQVESIDSYSFNCEAILTAGDGAGVGKVFHHYIGKFEAHQRVYVLHNFTNIHAKFLFFILKENFATVALLGNAKSTVDSLRMNNFTDFIVPLPPLHEQQAIVNYLDAQCAKLDTLISKTQRSIALLKEKRSTLITAAVTGKIDVREAVC